MNPPRIRHESATLRLRIRQMGFLNPPRIRHESANLGAIRDCESATNPPNESASGAHPFGVGAPARVRVYARGEK